MSRSTHSIVRIAAAAALTLAATPAFAQLDPLLFLKIQPQNVILVVETANRMQRDADLTYYDPGLYTKTGAAFEAVIGLQATDAAKVYRRKYSNLLFLPGGADKFSATHIDTLGDLEGGFSTFFERTRLAIARRSLVQAVTDNISSARFSLIKTRQPNPALPNQAGNDQPVVALDATQVANSELANGRYKITRTTVTAGQTNSGQSAQAPLVKADEANANANALTILNRDLGTAGALIPAGADDANTIDAPVGKMLDDARAEATRLIAADTSGCRNTVVVLVVGGGEGTIAPQDLAAKASTFLNVTGRRVPIYVVAIFPTAADATVLRAVAANSGGQYFEITKALVDVVAPGQPVPLATRAVNLAVQHTFGTSTNFNTAPTAELPFGPQTEFEVTSPIIGTVNLKGAQYFTLDTGAQATFPDNETEIYHAATLTLIPQRSNVLVTSGFALPGFEAKLRALRVYKPVPDTSKPSGFKFVQDGARMWVASTPAAASRNIYTVLPGSNTLVKFHTDNVAALQTYLRVTDASTLIDWVRDQPLGAIVGSTPAFLDPPSLDPPPDADYPGFREDNAHRRSLVMFGANDGMLHALDSRTGKEVWAFIPFNLLPKLRARRLGQSLDQFKYFVDSSPKIADVKVGGEWRTYLFIGEGAGGTFYNAFDVTLDRMADSVAETENNDGTVLNYFSDPSRIQWEWSFPRLTSFNHLLGSFGDVAATASDVEKTVGETWSDPAIGQVTNDLGPFVMVVGSGFLKRSVELQVNRGGARGGRSFYVLNVATGDVLASRDVGADNQGEEDDSCRASNNCTRIKNALQMDPVATGPADSRFISKAYIGDLDGKVWRFDMSSTGPTNVTLAAPAALYSAGAGFPLFSSMATVNVGGTKQYLFIGTGSDLLPSNGVNQIYSLLVLLDNGASATKTAEIGLEKVDGSGIDEKVTAFPAVAGDIVFFSTTETTLSTPCSPFGANLYAFTFIGGPAYDTNNDGRLSTNTSAPNNKKGGGGGGGAGGTDSTNVFSVAGVRATAPFIVDQHLVFAAGGKLEMFGDPEDFNNGVGQAGVRILSWRAVK